MVFCVILDILRVFLGSLWNVLIDQPSLSCLGSFTLVLETDGFFTYIEFIAVMTQSGTLARLKLSR